MANPSALENPPPAGFATIQALRGIAAFLVVCLHVAELIEARTGTWPLPHAFHAGMIGVDIFFCLSGFIMYFTSKDGFGLPGACHRFLLRRFLRIYPVYWVVAGLTLLVGIWEPKVVGGLGLSWGYVAKSLMLLPQNTSPIVGPGWTLVHEVRFYATFGLLLLLPRVWGLRGVLIWGILSFGILVVSYFDTGWLSSNLLGRALNYFFHPGSMEFALGVLAAWLVLHRPTTDIVNRLVLGAGVVGTLIVAFWFDELKPNTKYFAISLFAIPSFLLVLGLTLCERRWRMRVPETLVLLGDASYSTYLTHILLLVPIVGNLLPLGWLNSPFSLAAWSLVVFLHVAGVCFYLGIEGPLHRKARDWTKRLAPGSGTR